MQHSQAKRNHKPQSPAKGFTLLQLMLVLIAVGIIGTIAVHTIRHYTIH